MVHYIRECVIFSVIFLVLGAFSASAQTLTGTVEGKVFDETGAVLPGATVRVINQERGVDRSVLTTDSGDYRVSQLPVGNYEVSAELTGFKRGVASVTLTIGQVATVDFTLEVGNVQEQVTVETNLTSVELEPTRTAQSHVIDQVQIDNLPVNGREFIDFTLLTPGVSVGDTTSGSTDVIIEPTTKLSFAGQNLHFNFVAVDGADNISTASSIQRSSPPEPSVKEFRVINSNFGAEFGRAEAGIVNIITRSGSNEFHGSFYNFLRNDKTDAQNLLATENPSNPGDLLDEFRQNQFGATGSGALIKDRTFVFGNYEGQRRAEHPFFNTALTDNLEAVNAAKMSYGLNPENLETLRVRDSDRFLVRVDHELTESNQLFVRYMFDDQRAHNLSPLNDGFDAPSTFRNNFIRDQSVVANLTTTFSPSLLNELRGQFARRSFDFSTTTTEPHLEVANTFTTGVNRGNPDFYREHRTELVDNMTFVTGDHTFNFGGNFNFVRTEERFPIFIPFEATFGSVETFLSGDPIVFFFQKLNPDFDGFDTALFQGTRFSSDVLERTGDDLDHTYNGMFIQDKWQVTPKLTLNLGIRWEFETWPDRAQKTDWNNVDPRVGFAYNLGGNRKWVIRGGAGIFHGIIPAPLLLSQLSIGGTMPFPGREDHQNELNGKSPVFVFTSGVPGRNGDVLREMLATGQFPTAQTPFDFRGEFPIVRFAENHQAPYSIQGTLSLGFEVLPDTAMQISYQGVRGVHLGSFFNVNTPLQPSGTLESGKDDFALIRFDRFNSVPGGRDPNFALFFEADSRWNSIYHALQVNLNRRFTNHFSYGISYTYSKTIDDGPNPSFVLIPENSNRFDLERARSSDDVTHRFVANAVFQTPSDLNLFFRDWTFSTITTLQSPRWFSIFAGFDANGDGFPINDRVGLDGRNTFQGDSFASVDARVSRKFSITERVQAEIIAEGFNLFNQLNVQFFNTVFGDSIFNEPGTPGTFNMGARNPFFGTPRAINPPRQFQFALRLTW